MGAIVYSTDVDIEGVGLTREILREFEPDLRKRLNRDLNLAASLVKNTGQRLFERTGAEGVAYRISTRTSRGKFVKSITTQRGSVASGEKWSSKPGVLARVFELANGIHKAQPQNVRRTLSLIATLNARYGSPGRFLWEAWDTHKDEVMRRVESAIDKTEAEYTRRMQAAR